MSRASARAIKDFRDRVQKAGANLPPQDTKKTERMIDEQRDLYQRPTTGRNTKLGRKVEKPRDPKSGGPSGQKDRGRHDTKHTNK